MLEQIKTTKIIARIDKKNLLRKKPNNEQSFFKKPSKQISFKSFKIIIFFKLIKFIIAIIKPKTKLTNKNIKKSLCVYSPLLKYSIAV